MRKCIRKEARSEWDADNHRYRQKERKVEDSIKTGNIMNKTMNNKMKKFRDTKSFSIKDNISLGAEIYRSANSTGMWEHLWKIKERSTDI